MADHVNSLSELEITAYHEAGHTVVARLLGRPILSIVLEYRKQAEIWQGVTIKEPYSDNDPDWASFDLDQHIPSDELQFQYPSIPEPYHEYKSVRDFCTIDFAGVVSEELLYKHMSIVRYPKLSKECANDKGKANDRIEKKFPKQDVEKELVYAENHARKMLSNSTGWRLVENLAKALTDAVLQGRRPVKEDEFTKMYIFESKWVYASFKRMLTQGKN